MVDILDYYLVGTIVCSWFCRWPIFSCRRLKSASGKLATVCSSIEQQTKCKLTFIVYTFMMFVHIYLGILYGLVHWLYVVCFPKWERTMIHCISASHAINLFFVREHHMFDFYMGNNFTNFFDY